MTTTERLPEEATLTPEQAKAKELLQAELAAQARGDIPFDSPAARAMREARARAVIRTPPNQRITPASHVQAYADALQAATGVAAFGTYFGHSPTPERAVDIFVPVSPTTQGDRAAAWTLENWKAFGLRYLIWRQRINWNDGSGWQWMEDRGSVTNNHYDHLHAAHEVSAPDRPAPPPPKPAPKSRGNRMFLFWHLNSIYLAVPPYRSPEGLSGPNVDELAAQGTPVLGVDRKKQPNQFFDELKPW